MLGFVHRFVIIFIFFLRLFQDRRLEFVILRMYFSLLLICLGEYDMKLRGKLVNRRSEKEDGTYMCDERFYELVRMAHVVHDHDKVVLRCSEKVRAKYDC